MSKNIIEIDNLSKFYGKQRGMAVSESIQGLAVREALKFL